jgi:hypothetical protein
MKTLVSIILIFFSANLFAQSFSVAKDSVFFSGKHTDEEINGRISISNQTGSALTLRCIRTIESMPALWETSFCNKTNCFPNETDSIDFTVTANGTNYLLVHFYLKNTEGEGIVTLKVKDVNNPQFERNLTFVGSAIPPTGIENLFVTSMEIFPNPFQDLLNLRISAELKGDFKIFNAVGQCVSKGTMPGGTEKISIDVSSLDSGIYFLSVYASEKTITKKIVKR